MASYIKFHQFIEDLHHQVHNLDTPGNGGDQLVIFLTNTDPTQASSVLADVTEISYTNLSSRNITISASAQTSGTFQLTVNDLTLTASGGSVGPFQYVGVYNDTPTSPADPLINYYDNGSSITLADGESLDVDFDDANGLFQSA